MLPWIAPPVSAAIAFPYPSTYTKDPNGIKLGSTEIVLIPLGLYVGTEPVAVKPPPVYAVAWQYTTSLYVPVSPLLLAYSLAVPCTTISVTASFNTLELTCSLETSLPFFFVTL